MKSQYVKMFKKVLMTTLKEDVVSFTYSEKVITDEFDDGYDATTGLPDSPEVSYDGADAIFNSIDKSWSGSENFSTSNMKLWFLQENLEVKPQPDGKIIINSDTYQIVGIRQDFIRASWTLMLRAGHNV